MKESYQVISDALHEAGFKSSLEDKAGPLDFKITEYSLNTKLSFRFENLQDLIDFLSQTGHAEVEHLQASFMDLGIDPDKYFWVNFFEKGKEEAQT